VQIFGKTVQPNFGPAQSDLQPVQPNFGPAQPDLQPVQPNFGLAQPDLQPVQSSAESASEPKTPSWNPVQPFFSQISPTTTSFWGHLYIHLPHSSRWQSTTLERNLLSEIEELRFLCFISKSFLFFFIRALVLHRVLCGFITLGASSS
jgi:hypothetical protein